MAGPTRVLVLADGLASVVTAALRSTGVLVRVTAAAADARTALTEWLPHALVIELADGRSDATDELLRELRQPDLPVLGVSADGSSAARLKAFASGLDDVVSIPLMEPELALRLVALLRRTYRGAAPFVPVLRQGDLVIDLGQNRTELAGTEIRLTARERSLLYLLAAYRGRVVSREQILDAIWGVEEAPDSNVIDQHIRRLRRKLGDAPRRPRFIQSVPGRGYRFLGHP